MPTEALKSLAEKHGVSVKTAERYWDEAKDSAKGKGVKNKYAYMMGIVKKRMETSVTRDIEHQVLARLCILGGFVEHELLVETAASAKKTSHAPYRGAEKKIATPPKMAYSIFTLPHGPMDAEGLSYVEFKGESLDYAAYDPKTTSLWISFAGQHMDRWYWYKDVPKKTWDQFRRLKRNGIVYFNKEIRPIYDYALVENPKSKQAKK